MEKSKLKSIKISEELHRHLMMDKMNILINEHKNVTIEDVLLLWYSAYSEKH